MVQEKISYRTDGCTEAIAMRWDNKLSLFIYEMTDKLLCLILFFTSQSTMFQLCRDGTSTKTCLTQISNAVTQVRPMSLIANLEMIHRTTAPILPDTTELTNNYELIGVAPKSRTYAHNNLQGRSPNVVHLKVFFPTIRNCS